MNIDFYRNYIEIVERGTLSAAARSLHVAQSALSNQLKQFEEDYKTTLFIRTSRQMEPTDAGRILYKKAKEIVALVDASHKEIDAYVEGSQGVLRLGTTQAYPDVFMTELLSAFQKEHPQIRYEFHEESSHEVIELLRAGVIEIGVTRHTGMLPPFLDVQCALTENVCLYCNNNNPWFSKDKETINMKELDGVTLAISRGINDLVADLSQRENITPRIMSISTSRSNPMMWAKQNVACAIIRTGEAEALSDDDCFCRPLVSDDSVAESELRSQRTFIAVKEAVLSTAAQKFIDFSKQFIANR